MSFDRRSADYLHDGIDADLSYGTLGHDGGLFHSPKKSSSTGSVAHEVNGKDVHVSEATSMVGHETDAPTASLVGAGPPPASGQITKQPRSWYSVFCNRWLSLIGGLLSFAVMFAIHWIYALVTVVVTIAIYIYIGIVNSGVFPGIAEFSVLQSVVDGVRRCCRRGSPLPEQVIVTSRAPDMHTTSAQLTEDNEDFAGRGRYHQSEVVKGKNFDDQFQCD
jgi:potassium/chloride transporter 8